MIFVEKILTKDETGAWCEQQSMNTETVQLQSTKKDISFLAMEDWEQLNNDTNKGFCHQRFRPNIIISQFYMVISKPGTHFEIGNARLVVVGSKNRCHEACPRFQKSRQICDWKRRAFYADIILDGRIRKGDPLYYFIDQP